MTSTQRPALPTAPLAAASLICGYAVASASGSHPLGGAVLVVGGLASAKVWTARHGARRAAELAGVMFVAFAASHGLALAIGAWPAVLVVSAIAGGVVWVYADARERRRGAPC